MRQGVASTFPAAALLIQQGGEAVFHRAYGWVDPEQKQWLAELNTLFDLASLTKLFTATAFMTLVDTGKVALETPITEVTPEFSGIHPIQPHIDPHTKTLLSPDPDFEGKTVNADLVTFWHLLTHTSGLAAWVNLCSLDEQADAPFPHQVTQAERRRRLDAFLTSPYFVSPPGKRFLYSDLGFILLGEAIERLADMSLPDYFAQAIFAPLGMESITYNPLARSIPRQQIAPTEFCSWRGRRIWGEVHDENASCLGGVAGHAGLFATTLDAAVLGQCFLDKGDGVISPPSTAEMVKKQIFLQDEHRGLGWQLSGPTSAFSPHSFGHTGFTGTSLWVDPDRALVVVLLTNRVYYGREGEAIARFRLRLHEAIINIIDHTSEKTS